ncbi:MAG: hypothetical protein JRN26_07325 [Nitrososphaerota archaeon]|jgi:uncharacterized membrane protein|nr:hypothetical protein [Nitrososphaerota archaeon]MDG6927877.1 hypothetical protein [Nitrososphaerota archaeon]MDG6931022.1 hypothetical protein [Nitrososphaerota archaeon]MDG6932118.1 hypothetical protein [Nitrososphaerota archaeon]MDG6936673.1 hypothetical protein [Nitrososphaerota archaeon]
MKTAYSLAIVIITLVVVGGVIYQNYMTTPMVNVDGVNLVVNEPSNYKLQIVGKVLQPSSTFTIKASSFFEYELNITNHNTVTEYVRSVTSNTPGFSVPTTYLSESLPLSMAPGESKILDVTVATPTVSYSGPVNIIVNVTTTS